MKGWNRFLERKYCMCFRYRSNAVGLIRARMRRMNLFEPFRRCLRIKQKFHFTKRNWFSVSLKAFGGGLTHWRLIFGIFNAKGESSGTELWFPSESVDFIRGMPDCGVFFQMLLENSTECAGTFAASNVWDDFIRLARLHAKCCGGKSAEDDALVSDLRGVCVDLGVFVAIWRDQQLI